MQTYDPLEQGACAMAEVRAFWGIRYDTEKAGPLSRLIAPPYDVISPAMQEALYEASPHNIVRLELGREQGEARYSSAQRLFHEWRLRGILSREREPAVYLYEQEFEHGGIRYRRRSLIARVRLVPFEHGVVRPHEYTMSGPKEDRLRLMQATKANISPVYAIYRPGADDPIASFEAEAGATVQATDLVGTAHTLTPVTSVPFQQRVAEFMAYRTLYIADGHHRYETALRYRDDLRSTTPGWSENEAANFVMMALTRGDDPDLLILPIHRLVRPRRLPEDLRERLARYFQLRHLDGDPSDKRTVETAVQALTESPSPAFVVAGIEPGQLMLARLREREAVQALMPAERSAAWKALDVNVLQYGILDAALGIDIAAVTAGALEFSEDAEEAVNAVTAGQVPLALLVRPTRTDDIFAVADTGDRMPQKSTFFYPKLGTGLVIHSLS
jgi:uncharacterized protein (DUF1015 family)